MAVNDQENFDFEDSYNLGFFLLSLLGICQKFKSFKDVSLEVLQVNKLFFYLFVSIYFREQWL